MLFCSEAQWWGFRDETLGGGLIRIFCTRSPPGNRGDCPHPLIAPLFIQCALFSEIRGSTETPTAQLEALEVQRKPAFAPVLAGLVFTLVEKALVRKIPWFSTDTEKTSSLLHPLVSSCMFSRWWGFQLDDALFRLGGWRFPSPSKCRGTNTHKGVLKVMGEVVSVEGGRVGENEMLCVCVKKDHFLLKMNSLRKVWVGICGI